MIKIILKVCKNNNWENKSQNHIIITGLTYSENLLNSNTGSQNNQHKGREDVRKPKLTKY